MNEMVRAALELARQTSIRDEARQILEGVTETPLEFHTPQEGYHLPEGYVMRTHPRTRCVGEFCSIHNPSDHPLKDAPRNWRGDRGLMERMCVHEVGHPDPDDLAFQLRTRGDWALSVLSMHGCCIEACCGVKSAVIDGEVVPERREIEG